MYNEIIKADLFILGVSTLSYSCSDGASRRKNATRETTSTLKAWLQEHQKNPYPTKGEKIMLAIITRMTLTQVSFSKILSFCLCFTLLHLFCLFTCM